MRASATKTVVVGMGNIIHQDDGAGVHALRRLQVDPRLPGDAILIDGGTRGIELLAELHDCARLLLLDAMDVAEKPGTILRMTGDDLRALRGGASVHQIGLADLLATLPLVSDKPTKIILLGIQPAKTDWGTELSAAVEENLEQLVDAAIEQLLIWSHDNAVTDTAQTSGPAWIKAS